MTFKTDEPGDSPRVLDALTGSGEMAARIRSYDWACSSLGPAESWPQSLRTALSIMLASGYPMAVGWGSDYIYFYNDSYIPVLGDTKHQAALGRPAVEIWPEVWDVVGSAFDSIMRSGGDVSAMDQLFVLDRAGYPEETYFDFSYSAIRDETGGVGGVLVTCSETTGRVLGKRRVHALRDLATHTATAQTAEAACVLAAEVLAEHRADIPFALFYLLDRNGRQARRVGVVGLPADSAAAPAMVDLCGEAADLNGWPLAEVARTGQPQLVGDVGARFGRLPGGMWPDATRTALVLPVARPGHDQPEGIMVAAISPRRALDEEYRTFLDLVAGQVGTAVANARAYEEERKRAEALAELDRAKTTFFSNVSHEFRTPLTLLLGPLQDLLRQPDNQIPQAAHEELKIMYRNGLRLLKLVNTLLDFSRIEAGRIQAVYEPTDLAGFTAELAGTFRSAIERAGLRLVVDYPPVVLSAAVYVDRDQWEKIVLNLLSNAFKFTFDGEIAVSLRPAVDGSAVELAVRDTGVGISPEEMPRLFERFHRITNARSRSYEGSGIGLALARELVKLHGGEIRVESIVGRGTTFRVSIPTGSAHLPADQIGGPRSLTSTALSATPYVEEALRWLPDALAASADGNELGRIDEAVVLPGQTVDTGGCRAVTTTGARVLVVDDNADMRGYLARLLSKRYHVQAMADGAGALAAALANPPDLVLADVMMPGLDGFALLRALRADSRTNEVPVVLLSARAGEEAKVEGLERGADDYLVKPFSSRELLARVESQIELSWLRRETARLARQALEASEIERVRLADLFQHAPAGLAVLRGPEHVFESANERYVQMIGLRDVIGTPIRKAFPELEGQGFFELLDRVYATGEPHTGIEERVLFDRRGDGVSVEIFVNYVYQPLRDAGGQIAGILVHGVDVTEQVGARQQVEELVATLMDEHERLRSEVTERERAEEALRFLVQASGIPTESLEYDATLQRLIELTVPALADWVTVDLVERESYRCVAAAHADPAKASLLWEIRRRYPLMPEGLQPGSHALRSGQTALYPEMEDLPTIAEDREHLALLRDLAPVSAIAVPLSAQGVTIGVMTLASTRPEGRFDRRAIKLAEELASRATVAVENAQLYQALTEREQQLQELLGKLLTAQEEERRHIAYEVHEELAQVAASTHQHLQAFASRHRPQSPEADEQLDRIVELAQFTIREARRIVANLRPTVLDDYGLEAAVRTQVKELQAAGWEVDWQENLGDERLPPVVEASVFRVVQEALRNVRKHTVISRVRIRLERQEGAIHLDIQDWGQGFDPERITPGGAGERVGLASMRERITLLGGRFEVESRPGAGTRVVAIVPASGPGSVLPRLINRRPGHEG